MLTVVWLWALHADVSRNTWILHLATLLFSKILLTVKLRYNFLNTYQTATSTSIQWTEPSPCKHREPYPKRQFWDVTKAHISRLDRVANLLQTFHTAVWPRDGQWVKFWSVKFWATQLEMSLQTQWTLSNRLTAKKILNHLPPLTVHWATAGRPEYPSKIALFCIWIILAINRVQKW